MGVRTLIGKYDGTEHAAVMVDSASGWCFGPVFESPDAEEQIEAFTTWLREMRWYEHRAEIFGGIRDYRSLPDGLLMGTGEDPREWTLGALERLYSFWRERHVDEHGYLRGMVAVT